MNRKEEIEAALVQVRAEIPEGVTLIVVTKTFPVSDAQILYELGERDLGENRDEEGVVKAAQLPSDTTWHFQGRIQSKKIRSILSWADYIHSLDSESHAAKLDAAANSLEVRPKIFVQINLDPKKSPERSGIEVTNFKGFIDEISSYKNLEIVGVMGVAPLGGDPAPGFELLAQLSQELQQMIPGARYISAGMSGDYRIALTFGATHIRLGSSILGSR